MSVSTNRFFRSIKASAAGLQYLGGSAFPTNFRQKIGRTAADDRYHRRREKVLRRLVCRCPWWIDGHLHLGLLQIETAERQIRSGRSSGADRLQLLETLRISAQAAEELIESSGADAPGGGPNPPAELLEARFLKAMERYLSGDIAGAFDRFTEILLPRFQSQLRREVWLMLHEYAGYAAMTVAGLPQAIALFEAIPHRARSHDIEKLLAAAAVP